MLRKTIKLMIPLAIIVAAVILAMVMVGSREELKPVDSAQPLPGTTARGR